MDDEQLQKIIDGLFDGIAEGVALEHDPDENMGAYLAALWDLLAAAYEAYAVSQADDQPGPVERDLLDRLGFGDHST